MGYSQRYNRGPSYSEIHIVAYLSFVLLQISLSSLEMVIVRLIETF